MTTIYKITNKLNGKPYVGQTRQPIEKRFLQHSKAKTPLGNAMRDCGIENFTIEVIEECATQVQANERERALIKELDCKVPNGYNRSDGGERGDFYYRKEASSNFPLQVEKNTLDLLAEENKLSTEDKAFIESFLCLSPRYRAILREICTAFAFCDACLLVDEKTIALLKSLQAWKDAPSAGQVAKQ